MQYFFRDLREYGNYINYAAKAKLKEDLGRSYLGWIWWILEPAVFVLIYMFVFTVVFQRTTEYLVAFIFIGISLWRFFNSTIQGSVPLIKRNRKIITRIYLPKFALVLTTMLANGVKLLFSFVVVAGLLVYYRVTPSVFMLQLIPALLVLFLLTFGVSLLVMHIGVYFEDLANCLRPALQLLFYASGVFYPLDGAWGKVNAEAILWLNPIALVLHEARNALLYQTAPNWLALGYWAWIGGMVTAIGILLIYQWEDEYVKIV